MDDAFIGAALGRYRVVDRLGAGGTAAVNRAHGPAVDRDVALKIARADLAADPTFATRFAREARAAARLQHPHILALRDYGEQDGHACLVMPPTAGVPRGPGVADSGARATAPQPRRAKVVATRRPATHSVASSQQGSPAALTQGFTLYTMPLIDSHYSVLAAWRSCLGAHCGAGPYGGPGSTIDRIAAEGDLLPHTAIFAYPTPREEGSCN